MGQMPISGFDPADMSIDQAAKHVSANLVVQAVQGLERFFKDLNGFLRTIIG